jgi:leucyl aminopeptidase
MKPTISGAAPDFGTLDVPLLVVALPTSPSVTPELAAVDAATNGALGRAITRRDFRGGRDETLHLAGGERGIQRILLVGMGPASDRAAALRRAGAIAARQASRLGVGRRPV